MRLCALTRSDAETMALASDYARQLPPDCTLALSGDLGAGKSTFVRGLARGWGIEQPITSPSYNLFYTYQGQRQLIHVDAYRLENPDQAESLLIEDLLEPPFCLAVEWPEKIEAWLPEDTRWIDFSIINEDGHPHRIEERAQ